MTSGPTIDPDRLLRELYASIEGADNSCSESEDSMRGMQFMFDLIVEKIGCSVPDLAKQQDSSQSAATARCPGLRPT